MQPDEKKNRVATPGARRPMFSSHAVSFHLVRRCEMVFKQLCWFLKVFCRVSVSACSVTDAAVANGDNTQGGPKTLDNFLKCITFYIMT